jgi:ribosomal protein L37AE/L43A
MPLSAKRQMELRADKKEAAGPKKLGPRKRCDNCDKRFHKNRKDQRFCCANCRKEFFANGGNAFGPLKVRLEKLVKQLVRPLEVRLTSFDKRLREIDEVLQAAAQDWLSSLLRESVPSQSPNPPSPSETAASRIYQPPPRTR